jgi:hypothetical protein
MRKLTLILLALYSASLMFAISSQDISKDINFWNERFPSLADSVHHNAQVYYKSAGLFSKQAKNESNSDYVIRLLSTYRIVKKHEYDPLLSSYRKMFVTYSHEFTMSSAKCILSPYDADAKRYDILVCIEKDTLNIDFWIPLEPDMARLFWENWNSYNKTVYGGYGISNRLLPTRLLIHTSDNSFVLNVKANFIESFRDSNPNTSTIIPIRNYNSFLVEPRYNPEYFFDPVKHTYKLTNFHLNCRSVASNLMANRLIGRTPYPYQQGEYNISKWDLSSANPPDSIIHGAIYSKNNVYTNARHTCALSPDGRIIINQTNSGIFLYDFESGKMLEKVSDSLPTGNYDDSGIYYAFDPYKKKIYFSGIDSIMVYDVVEQKLSLLKKGFDRLSSDNSSQQMAYWSKYGSLSSSHLGLLDFKSNITKTIELSNDASGISQVVFSPDDRYLAVVANVYNGGSNHVFIVDGTTGEVVLDTKVYSQIGSLSYTKDGQNLLCAPYDNNGIFVIHLGIADGQKTIGE